MLMFLIAGMTPLQSGTLRLPPASVTTIEARPQKL